MTSRLFATLLLAASLMLPSTPVQAQRDSAADPMLALRAFDSRVATIGHRLAVASLDLCPDREWRPGVVLHHLSQYSGASREAAVRAFGLDRGPGVLALAAGGPGERAGLRPDDILLAVDGVPLPTPANRSFEAMEPLLDAFERAFSDGAATLDLLRGGRPVTIQVPAELGCATRFQAIPARSPDARADGRYVQLHDGLARYVRDDSELAAVIAHEFAHNVLRHKARLDALQVRRGASGNFGRNAVLIRETEVEAERLSVYLLHRAGFDPEAAVRFWTHFGRRGLNFLKSPTHPSWRRRIALFEEEIRAIRSAEAAGVRPMPGFLPGPVPPAASAGESL